MDDISIGLLFAILVGLILLSGFFSGSETALMTLNRYKLKSMADSGHQGAKLARKLLKRPDRLLGLILLGNNIVNIVAATIATIIAFKLYGEIGILIAPLVLAFVILVFAEVTPKTLAALKPEKIAYPSAYIYTLLWKPFSPFVWLINIISNGLLALIGVRPDKGERMSLNADELRAAVSEAEQFIPGKHSDMLLRILDLEKITVEDIMVPRNNITGIDLNDEWGDIENQISLSQRTRVPVFIDSIDNTVGILHLRKVLNLLTRDELNMDTLKKQMEETYFVPAATALTKQLLNFQKNRKRSGLVVDEYGSIQGLVTLEDILEEIVGEFTTDSPVRNIGIHLQENGSYQIDGNTHIRDINRVLNWSLPTDGPKTLNGLILEHMEMIPEAGTSIMIAEHPIEITKTSSSAVLTAKISGSLAKGDTSNTTEETDRG